MKIKHKTKHPPAASQEDGQICFVNMPPIFFPGQVDELEPAGSM